MNFNSLSSAIGLFANQTLENISDASFSLFNNASSSTGRNGTSHDATSHFSQGTLLGIVFGTIGAGALLYCAYHLVITCVLKDRANSEPDAGYTKLAGIAH